MHARPWTRPLATLAAILLFGGVALAACGDDDNATKSSDTTTTADRYGNTEDTSATLPGDAGGEDEEAPNVVAMDFSLTDATVAPGADIYFANQGSQTHTMTSDDGTSFDSGNVAPGDTKELKAPTEPGTYAFHCTIHPAKMKATLTVEG